MCVKNPDDPFLDIFSLAERTLAPWLACYHVVTVRVWSSDLPFTSQFLSLLKFLYFSHLSCLRVAEFVSYVFWKFDSFRLYTVSMCTSIS